MDNLPTEVVRIIAGYMSGPVLKVFRETSKRNAEVGAAFLFAEVRSTLSKLSFGRILEIALCPTISKLVQSFHLDITALNETVQEFAHWEALVREEDEEAQEEESSYIEGINKSYKEFSSMLARQLVPSPELAGIVQIIRHFKRLEIVSISSEKLIDIEGFPLASKSDEGEGSLPALVHKYVLESIGSGTDAPKITTLSIALPWTSVEDRLGECIEQLNTSLARQIGLQNWQSLRKFEITLQDNSEFSHPNQPFLAVRSFLKMLQNIQELSIIVGFDYSRMTGVLLDDILDTEFKWPRLRSLVLEGFRTESEALLKFIKLQFPPSDPVCLSLHGFRLTSGDWGGFLMDACKSLNLQAVSFQGILSQPGREYRIQSEGDLAKSLCNWMVKSAKRRCSCHCPLLFSFEKPSARPSNWVGSFWTADTYGFALDRVQLNEQIHVEGVCYDTDEK